MTITIPRKVTKGEELVIISRKDYERFLRAEKKEAMADDAIKEGLRDLQEGRVSPTFSSAKTAIKYLHRQAKKFSKSR